MRKLFLLLLAIGLASRELTAQKALESISVPTEPDSSGGVSAALCCTPQYSSGDRCACDWTYPGNGPTVMVSVENLCRQLIQTVTAVAPEGRWQIATRSNPKNLLYEIDCRSNRGKSLAPTAGRPGSDPQPSAVQPQQPAAGPTEPSGNVRLRELEADSLSLRVEKLEGSLREERGAIQNLQDELKALRGTGPRDLEKKLGALRKELLERLRVLEEAQKNSCYRIEDRFKGQDEVMIAVGGGVLRFVRVKPRSSTVTIGLSEAKADEFLAEAQAHSSHEIFPHILLAVPEAVREVKPFLLQDRLIDPQLYSRLTRGQDAGRVAFQEVERFIVDLNARCIGRAKFSLPTEEQFVAAAQWLYDPVANGLKPCESVRVQDRQFEVTELLGQSWQLTRSPCKPFSVPPRTTCPDFPSYIRKGGAASSTDQLECIPEYRSPAPVDVNQKETSFRLVLAE